MPGPAPKPTALRLLEGNPAKRALPKREPNLAAGTPECPAWASKTARKNWIELAEVLKNMGVATAADKTAIGLFVDALSDYLDAKKIVEREGLTFETDKGYKVAHPAVAMKTNAWERVLKIAKEFGLSPAARTKVATVGETKPDEFEQFMGRRA